ncbi:MAG: hypothetical protein RLP02_35215 [Coleofasciculus sp. C2-GNP5-27]
MTREVGFSGSTQPTGIGNYSKGKLGEVNIKADDTIKKKLF